MPRPMPLSKYEAERLMLNVIMHLVCIPDIDHAVRVHIRRGDLEFIQQPFPMNRAMPETPFRLHQLPNIWK